MSAQFTLGQRVTVDLADGLVRRALDALPNTGYNPRKEWTKNRYAPAGQIEGIVVGLRTYSDGRVSYEYDAGTSYHPDRDGYFPVVLVAHDLRRAPVPFRPEDVLGSNNE